MDFSDDPVEITAAGYPLPRTAYALVHDGAIMAIAQRYDHARHPFAGVDGAPPAHIVHGGRVPVPLAGYAVVRVTGTDAAVGHLVDEHGNVTPAEGRTHALLPGESALHAPTPEQVEPEYLQEEDHGEADDEPQEQPASE